MEPVLAKITIRMKTTPIMVQMGEILHTNMTETKIRMTTVGIHLNMNQIANQIDTINLEDQLLYPDQLSLTQL
jgi:hypothetical protein